MDAHKNVAILCHTLSGNYTDEERARLAYEHYAAYFELGGGDERLRDLYEELLEYREQILGVRSSAVVDRASPGKVRRSEPAVA